MLMTRETHLIPDLYQGQRLDAVLAQLFPDFSRTHLSRALKAGAFLLNNQPAPPKQRLKGGESLSLDRALIASPLPNTALPEAIPLTLLYEDEQLLVINKPAGLIVHPGAGNPQHTLVNALLFYHPQLQHLPRAGLIHRLDKDTTGALLIAKTQTAYTALSTQMRARQIQRQYVALVQGHLPLPYTLTTHFGRDPRNRLKMAVTAQGREAITHYQALRCFQHFTLLHVTLLTGRTHQIRVHLTYIKHPIVGDPLYGKPLPLGRLDSPELRSTLLSFSRQALHAETLSFMHPITHTPLTLQAPLPEDLKALLACLENTDA